MGAGFLATTTCDQCPWRKDVEVGRFPPERFVQLRKTIEQGFGNPIFACHKTNEGKDQACVGFLMVDGGQNFAVRMAVNRGDLDFSKLVAKGPLYRNFAAMERANDPEGIDIRRASTGARRKKKTKSVTAETNPRRSK